jgi:NarL family two-component system response regulator LiaR
MTQLIVLSPIGVVHGGRSQFCEDHSPRRSTGRLQPLSPREREVLRLIARGHSNRQIARDLAIGEQTVKTHVRSILTKLGLQDRVQAAIFALRHQADSCEQP